MQLKHKPFHVAGCGTRRLRGTYLYTHGLGASQDPQEAYRLLGDYICDPPIYLDDPGSMGIAPQGISVSEIGGVYHAFDWIGTSEGYLNAADILMEIMYKDGSTLVPINKNLELLEPGVSHRFLVHPNGIHFDPSLLQECREELPFVPECFLPEEQRAIHLEMGEYCAALHWQVVNGGRPAVSKDSRKVLRTVGDLTYNAISPPKNFDNNMHLAIIARIPIHEIHLVVGDGKTDLDLIQEAVDLLGGLNLSLPIFLTDN